VHAGAEVSVGRPRVDGAPGQQGCRRFVGVGAGERGGGEGLPESSRATAITRDRPFLSGSRCDPGSRPDSRATADPAFAYHSSGAVSVVAAWTGRVQEQALRRGQGLRLPLGRAAVRDRYRRFLHPLRRPEPTRLRHLRQSHSRRPNPSRHWDLAKERPSWSSPGAGDASPERRMHDGSRYRHDAGVLGVSDGPRLTQ
jgi:hypothetical protein